MRKQTHVFFLLISFLACNGSLNELGPLRAPVYHFPEHPAVANLGYTAFQLDTNSQQTSIHKSDCGKSHLNDSLLRPTTLTLYTRKLRPANVGVAADCLATDSYSQAALGPGKYALPRQLSAYTRLPPTFSYCLPPPQNGNGSIVFGTEVYSVPLSRGHKHLDLVKIPMELPSYQVQLVSIQVTGAGVCSPNIPAVFSSTNRVTSLPNDTHRFVSSSVLNNLYVRGINETLKSNDTAYEHCFHMTEADMRASPELRLYFSGAAPISPWLAPPETYFVTVENGYCLGFVGIQENATAAVIGTLLQQGRIVEYNLQNKTLGFSKLLSDYGSSCEHTLH